MQEWNGIPAYTVTGRLDELAEAGPDRRCFQMGELTRTFAETRARSIEIARALSGVGAAAGDRVATLAPNRPELIDLFFGIPRLGAIQVSLNPFLKGDFLRHQLADSESSVVVTDVSGLEAIRPMLSSLPSLTAIVLLDGPVPPGSLPVPVHLWDSLPSADFPDPDISPASLMSIMYTSGTTGPAKGCMLTHGYGCRVGAIDGEMMRLTTEDVFFTSLPMFHAGAQLKVIMTALVAGIPFVVEPVFSATGFFRSVTESGATVANAVGAMAAMILATPPSEWDRAHRLRILNVVPLAPALQEAFVERFGTDPWTEGYGQTECTLVIGADPFGPRDRSAQGDAVRDVEVALLDDDGEEVPHGEMGEICVRPRHRFAMFSGYWRNPEATLAAYAGLWYHTGDYGRRTSTGAIQFVDRKKDAMRVRGENVSSMELESAIALHPAVAEAAVHAVTSDLEEDDIKACVVLAEGASLPPGEFFEWLRDHVPYFAVPRYVELMDELPKNQVSRVLKFELRARGVTEETWDFRALGYSISRDERR